jgi:hypothetical protein
MRRARRHAYFIERLRLRSLVARGFLPFLWTSGAFLMLGGPISGAGAAEGPVAQEHIALLIHIRDSDGTLERLLIDALCRARA